MPSRELKVIIAGDAAQLLTSLRSSGSALERFGATTDKTTSRTSRLAHSVGHGLKIAGLAAIPVVGLLAYQLKGAVDAAAAAETAQIGLRQALHVSDIAYGKNKQRIQDLVAAESALSGFTETDLVASFGQFVRASGSVTYATKLQNLAIDLARAKNMDLGSAMKTILTLQAGSYRSLKTLGIQYTASTTNVDKLRASTTTATTAQVLHAKALDRTANKAKVLALLQDRVGGSAARWGKTAAGSLARMDAAWEQIKVTIGTALIPTIKTLADKFGAWLLKAQKTGEINKLIKETRADIVKAGHAITIFAHGIETAYNDAVKLENIFSSIAHLGGVGDFINRHDTSSIPGVIQNLLGQQSQPGNQQPVRGGRAGGGFALPGGTYDVGEKGRERLSVLPGGGAYVTALPGGGRQPLHLTQNFYGVQGDPRVWQGTAVWNLRRLLPHGVA